MMYKRNGETNEAFLLITNYSEITGKGFRGLT
jgi:hypothetical protein